MPATYLTGLTHYAPYPHTPEASYEHSISSGVQDGMRYEIGTCRVCNARFRTDVPFVEGSRSMDYGRYVYSLGKEQAHAEALAAEATFAELTALFPTDQSEALYRAEEELPHALFLRFAEQASGEQQPAVDGRPVATLTDAAQLTTRRDGSTSVEFSTEHYTFRLLHSTAWAGSKAADRRTRLYAPTADMDDMDMPPAGRKGDNPNNDKAWRTYHRIEVDRQRVIIADAVAELAVSPLQGVPWPLAAELAGACYPFSRKAGCSCGCSPGYVVHTRTGDVVRDGYKSVSDIFISRKAVTAPALLEPEDDDEADNECEGHPAGPYDDMGVTVYCDGTCSS